MNGKVLQKFIAESGYCSRRKAQELIKQGKVKVNDQQAQLGDRVNEQDKVLINDKPIQSSQEPVYIKLNKPKGYVCSNRKFKNEKNIFDLIPKKERIFTVGRLDKNSHGLVLLTNDGEWAHKITHPSFECEKEYQVILNKKLNPEIKDKIEKEGIQLAEEKTRAKVKKIERAPKKNNLAGEKYKIILAEGKKRQIKRIFEKFNYQVLDLKRTRIGNYKLKNLKQGEWCFIDSKHFQKKSST